jgi:hypothetical protein
MIIDIITILIILMLLLFVYNLGIFIKTKRSKIIEGNTSYQSYAEDGNSAMALAVQNEGNINFLKDQLDQIQTIKTQILDLSQNVTTNTQAIQSIGSQMTDTSDQLTGDMGDDDDDDDDDTATADDVSDQYDALD